MQVKIDHPYRVALGKAELFVVRQVLEVKVFTLANRFLKIQQLIIFFIYPFLDFNYITFVKCFCCFSNNRSF